MLYNIKANKQLIDRRMSYIFPIFFVRMQFEIEIMLLIIWRNRMKKFTLELINEKNQYSDHIITNNLH